MLKVGMEIQTPSLLLKVDAMRGTWVRFLVWDKSAQKWKLRGYTEKAKEIEEKLESGVYFEVKKEKEN